MTVQTINDPLYGTFPLREPVLLELLQSRALRRLQRVSQYGIPAEFYFKPGFTRYDHSAGVMLLLRKLGASLEEQIAGLLHDASHTAFSHLIDWVIGDRAREDFQDKHHSSLLQRYGIPSLLERHGFSFEHISDPHSFSLLEQPAPDLCADRVDYALREFQLWAAPSLVDSCIASLAVHDGKIVFSSSSVADAFARTYLRCQREHWGHSQSVIRYEFFSSILNYALQHQIITLQDFYEDDEFVMKKLLASPHSFIHTRLDLLRSQSVPSLPDDSPLYSFKKKFRWVDPLYLDHGALYRLSETHPEFQAFLASQRQLNQEGIRATLP